MGRTRRVSAKSFEERWNGCQRLMIKAVLFVIGLILFSAVVSLIVKR